MSRSPVFVTRKFPPSVGGMETLAAGVWRSLVLVRPDARRLAHGGANRDLVWWVPWCLLRLIVLCARRRVSYVLCGDALMNALCTPILRAFRIPHATMIMGLDVTFDHPVYRAIVRPRLRSADHVIAISAATADAARAVGVADATLTVLRLGVEPPATTATPRSAARAALVRRAGLTDDARIIVTLGRLVPRKGVRWFCEAVLPRLDANVHYLIAGRGPDEAAIRAAAERAGVAARVHLLGRVPDDERELLLNGADVFVQPNIPVAGDMEGFGLVAVEAAMRGVPVVAARLEGIHDAVVDGETGRLVAPEDAEAWVAALASLPTAPDALAVLGAGYAARARELYSERGMGEALVRLLGLEPTAAQG